MSLRERSWKVRFLLGALALMFLSGKPVFGQTQAITATLNGTVVDSSGEPVSGAKITLSSPERGISRASATGSTGLYSFTLLPPGVYTLVVEVPGLQAVQTRWHYFGGGSDRRSEY